MRKLLVLFILSLALKGYAQKEPGVVQIIDDLTIRWDREAISLKFYQGILDFCATEAYRKEVVDLLDNIHHLDTTLYFIVQEKYAVKKDKEAEATLEDILKLETDYPTEKFKHFIQEECALLKEIEKNFESESPKEFERDMKAFEKELVKYVNSITYRIDIIDEHIHHLHLE
ncbi:MAG: hypothetical protein Tsb0034_03520 [Ekhidna sp.]